MENQVNEEVKEEIKEEVNEEIVFHDDTPEVNASQPKGEKNKLAIASFVLAIISIVVAFIPSDAAWLGGIYYLAIFAGLILSIVALVQIKKKNQSGKIFAILGLVGVILSFVLIFVIGIIQLTNMPEQDKNNLIYCPYVTECVDNGDKTSTCLYVDDSEVVCSNDFLTEDQYK